MYSYQEKPNCGKNMFKLRKTSNVKKTHTHTKEEDTNLGNLKKEWLFGTL